MNIRYHHHWLVVVLIISALGSYSGRSGICRVMIVLIFIPVIRAPPRIVMAAPLLIGARIIAGSNSGQVLGNEISNLSLGPPI